MSLFISTTNIHNLFNITKLFTYYFILPTDKRHDDNLFF